MAVKKKETAPEKIVNPNDKGVIANSFKAFESLIAQGKMAWHMFIFSMIILFIIQLIVVFGGDKLLGGRLLYNKMTAQEKCITNLHLKFYALEKTGLIIWVKDGLVYDCEKDLSPQKMERVHFYQTFKPYIDSYLMPRYKYNLKLTFTWTALLIYPSFFWIVSLLNKHHVKSTSDDIIRGNQIVSPEVFKKVLDEKYANKKGRIFMLNEFVGIPEAIVTRHNFVIGKPGSGKSQFIIRFIEELIKNDVKFIIHDFKGDFIPAYYDETKHYIFNPVDQRHMGIDKRNKGGKNINNGWSIFNEIKTHMDIDSFAASVIPEPISGEKFWADAPRDIFKAMMIYCLTAADKENNPRHKTNQRMYELLESGVETLKEIFEPYKEECSVAMKHLEEAKLSAQLMSILSATTSYFKYLCGTDGDFSIKKWVEDEDSEIRGIFVANQASVQKALAPLIGTFVDFATKSLNSLKDDMNRRLYFILDEFGQLSKIPSVIQLLTQARSKGGAAFLLIQDQAQIAQIYGQEGVKSIVNSCGNKFYFAVGDHSTAEQISQEIGTAEVERNKESKSYGVGDFKDTISQNADIVERRVMLAAEIMDIKTLRCIAKMTDLPTTYIDTEYKSPGFEGREQVDAYVEREDMRVSGKAARERAEKTAKDDEKLRMAMDKNGEEVEVDKSSLVQDVLMEFAEGNNGYDVDYTDDERQNERTRKNIIENEHKNTEKLQSEEDSTKIDRVVDNIKEAKKEYDPGMIGGS